MTSSRSESFTVEVSLPSERLDTFLRERFPAVSRGTIQRLIEQGHIKVNGQTIKPTHHPRAGELIEVYWPEARPAEARPEDIPLDIIFEDSDLLVLNKAPGLVVHPAAGHEEHTLVNALLHHCEGQLSGIGGVARPGIVHRLDKETSGCLVVAKNDAAHMALAEQFSGRTLEKTYLAIVCGEVVRNSGEIRASIARHPTHRKRMTVTDGSGREAWTSYKVRERFSGATWLEALLHTGRTHQIRVHFQHLGYPIVGDATYGTRQNKRLIEVTGYAAPRQMLHAWKLSFLHPCKGKKLSFEAPWPADFQTALASLRKVSET
ncbi:RluA family pseudouridine synthase [Pedosphaera parvula]|uniref:Pseudouridine synthase n=1 Tax=Pedosphaera parvula (strain Ellin514) TaxID=320771 RepID=B9XQ39_PEDPL|nr:RluA family pseudouridine synthase [Pedosphaera parvula]EEF58043.1 pseudouridine synthase, RluA family [Pedosphaera parvula Ellin514]